MNRYQNALNRVSIHCVDIHYEEDEVWHERACEEELKLLQELVDKETPKKPHYEGDGMWNGLIVYDTWICPNCGKSYEVDYEEVKAIPSTPTPTPQPQAEPQQAPQPQPKKAKPSLV